MMEGWRILIIILVASEILIYFIEFWRFAPIEKNAFWANILYSYGIPIFRETVESRHSKEKVINFIKENIKPAKFVGDKLFIRRKYLKWVMWATPVPLKSVIEFKGEKNKSCKLEVEMKTIFLPFLASVSPIIISVFSEQLGFGMAIISSVLLIILIYLISLLEKAAIMTKIRKIANLDKSYTLFS